MTTASRFSAQVFGNREHILKAYRHIDDATRELVFKSTLKASEPIVCCEFYSPTRLVVVDWNATVEVFDIASKSRVYFRKFGGSVSCRALVSADKQFLYVAHDGDKNASRLCVIALEDFSEVANHPFPRRFHREREAFNLETRHMSLRPDGKLLFYFEDSKQGENGSQKPDHFHGFHVVEPMSGAVEQVILPHPPLDPSGDFLIALDQTRGLGVLVCWQDHLEIRHDPQGEPLFVFEIMLVDTTRFEILRVIAVREFSLETLQEALREKYVKALLGGSDEEGYARGRKKFQALLNDVKIVEDESALWLAWDDEKIQKVGLDGTVSSPMQVTVSNAWFHKANRDRLVLRSGSHLGLDSTEEQEEVHVIDLNQLNGTETEVEALTMIEHADLKTLNAQKSRGVDTSGKVVITVDDLSEDASRLEVLDQLVLMTRDLDNHHKGGFLDLLIVDRKKKKIPEEKFFKEVMTLPGAIARVQLILQNFAVYEKARELYIHEEATALCYAAKELALADSGSLPAVLRYLSVIDGEHDVFNGEKTLPALLKKYANTEFELKLRMAFAMLDMQQDAFDFLYKGFHTPKSFCNKWLAQPGNATRAAGFYQELLALGFKPTFFDKKLKASPACESLAKAIFHDSDNKVAPAIAPTMDEKTFCEHIDTLKQEKRFEEAEALIAGYGPGGNRLAWTVVGFYRSWGLHLAGTIEAEVWTEADEPTILLAFDKFDKGLAYARVSSEEKRINEVYAENYVQWAWSWGQIAMAAAEPEAKIQAFRKAIEKSKTGNRMDADNPKILTNWGLHLRLLSEAIVASTQPTTDLQPELECYLAAMYCKDLNETQVECNYNAIIVSLLFDRLEDAYRFLQITLRLNSACGRFTRVDFMDDDFVKIRDQERFLNLVNLVDI